MPSQPPLDGIDRTSIYEFSRRTIVVCGTLVALVVAVTFGSTIAHARADDLRRLFSARDRSIEPATEVLVITANRRYELVVVATLSPRGFHPLLASTEREVLAQMRAHPGAMKLAVVDATLPEYASIARALRGSIPRSGIIVLKGHRSQDIGPMVLDRL